MGLAPIAGRLFFVAALATGAGFAQFKAGAAKLEITPDLAKHGPVYMAGFGQNRVATGVHDPLWTRCVALAPARRTLVVCEVDLIGLFHDDILKVRGKLPYYDVVVASTHDHEGPDTMGLWGPAPGKSGINEAYNNYVVDRIVEAAKAAVKAMQPASATLATVKNPLLDAFIADSRPPEVHDAGLTVLAISDDTGRGIATIVNWANHPETLDSKNTLITADYPAAFYKRVEQQLGGVAILWNGAVGGMQSPLGAKLIDPKTKAEVADGTWRKAEIIGEKVADLALDALQGEKPAEISKITFTEKLIAIPVTNAGFQQAAAAGVFGGRKKFGADGSMQAPVGLIRISGRTEPLLDIALIPGEMYPELSLGGVVKYPGADFPDAPIEPAIKPMLTAPNRMLIGLANDEIGYIIPKVEWDEKEPWLQNATKRWYGEINSVGPDAASKIAAAMRSLVLGR